MELTKRISELQERVAEIEQKIATLNNQNATLAVQTVMPPNLETVAGLFGVTPFATNGTVAAVPTPVVETPVPAPVPAPVVEAVVPTPVPAPVVEAVVPTPVPAPVEGNEDTEELVQMALSGLDDINPGGDESDDALPFEADDWGDAFLTDNAPAVVEDGGEGADETEEKEEEEEDWIALFSETD